MANKTMHHVVIGSDTYEIVDQYAREHGGGGSITVDTALSPTSTNPVQNKAIYAGIQDTADDLTDKINASYPTGTAGPSAIAVIDDGADDIPIKSLTVEIEPKRAGTGVPSPSNVRAITGWDAVKVMRTGKNLFDVNALTSLPTGNGITTTLKLKPNTAYTMQTTHGLSSSNAACAFFKSPTAEISTNGNGVWNGNPRTFTTSADGLVDVVCRSQDNETLATFKTYQYQVEEGPSATAYEPSEADTHTITLPTTVYGGTLDVTKGLLTVDRGFVTFDGSETWVLSGGKKVRSNIYALQNVIKKPTTASEVLEGLQASYLTAQTDNDTYQGTIGISCQTNGVLGITLTGEATTVDATKAYLAEHPLQVVYPLATPRTYTLTPTEVKTLLGENRIYADAGDVTVKYPAEIKGKVDILWDDYSSALTALG